jgi:tetratricopeptide (TPR) repeat protein/DNA-binding transcriptional ArsR family regulator
MPADETLCHAVGQGGRPSPLGAARHLGNGRSEHAGTPRRERAGDPRHNCPVELAPGVIEGRDGDSEKLDVLTRRSAVLRRLADAPAHVRDLVDEMDQSRSTVNRALNELEAVDLVERTDEGYAATLAGRFALEGLAEFREELDDVVAARPVTDPLPADSPLERPAVVGSEAHLATEPTPYRPLERFHGDLADATRYRAALPVLDDPRQARLLYEHVVTEGNPAELVVSPELLRALRTQFPRRMARMAETDGFRLLVGEVPPFLLGLVEADDGTGPATTVHAIVFNDSGGVHGLLANDAPGAVRWATDRYRAVRAAADERTDALLANSDGGGPTTTVDGGVAQAGVGNSVSVALEREGFVRLDASYFREEPTADPPTAWRAGLTIPEVHVGYAVERTLPAGSGGGDEQDADGPATDDATAGEPLSAALAGDLAAGRDCLLLGPPGSGKSTVCKQVACDWYDVGRGPVLYREGGRGRSFDSVDDLVVTVDLADGHTLVVVEDAVRPEADAVFEAIDRLGDREDVSFLLDARESEWASRAREPPGAADLAVRHVPGLSDRDCERLVDHFERTVGETVDVPVDRLRQGLREEAMGDDDTVHGEVLLLLHRLATYADPLADDRTSLEETVAAVYDDVADDPTALDVCVLANALVAAGLPVDAGALAAVADPGEYDRVEAAVERLEGRVLFPDGDDSYRTVHRSWSVTFLAHLLDAMGDRRAADRFGDCLTALLSLADEPGRREQIAAHLGDGETLAAVEDDPRARADDVVEALYALARERPTVAPLFGDGERDTVALPAACSVADRRPVWLGRAFERGGYLDSALAAADGGLEAVPAESRLACRLLGVRAAALAATGDYDAARETSERQRALAARLGDRELEATALERLGRAGRQQSDYERAHEQLQRSLEVQADLEDPHLEARTLTTLGMVAYDEADYEAAREHHEEALAIMRQVGDRRGEAKSFGTLGLVAFDQGDYGQAREHQERSLAIMRQVGDRRGEADSLGDLGLTARRTGDYEAARAYHEESLALHREMGDRRGEANDLGNLGAVAGRQGEYGQAREYFERSLELHREVGNRRGAAGCLGNLGVVTKFQGDYAAAREYYEEALSIKREVGDPRGEANTLTNLGTLHREQGDYERAHECHEAALAIRREVDDRQGEATTLSNLGSVATERGDLERAREHHEGALAIERDIGDRQGEASSRTNLAVVARERDDLETADEHLDAALATYEEIDDPPGVADVHLERGRVALERGDRQAAREEAERAREAYESLEESHEVARARVLQGRVAAEAGDSGEATEHWTAALETFEAGDAPEDALATVRRLLEAARERGADEDAARWRDRARSALETAPDTVADRHRGWVEDDDAGAE